MKNRMLQKSISIHASASKVWTALTDPELIKTYLFGTQTLTDWKVGSKISFKGEWEGKQYEDKGIILKCDKEKVLQYTYWSSFSGKPDAPENYLIVTFELKKKKNVTELTLKNENFDTQEALEHSSNNWDKVLQGLKEVAESI